MKVVFMGTPDFSIPILKSIIKAGHEVVGVVTQPDRPKGRKQELTKSPVKVLAELMNLEIYQPEKIRDKKAIEYVLSLEPDVIISAAFGQIIPDELLYTPKYKAINVHASLLPKYRGASPIHQSIIQGENETGISIMYMVKELDAGDVLSQATVKIEDNDTAGSLHDKLSQVGAKLLVDTLEKIEKDEINPQKQDASKSTYAKMLKREDELIDWNKSSKQIYNQIRGLNPWPVAFTYFRGKVMKIRWAQPVEYKHEQDPGTVVRITKDQLLIATLDGAIELKEIQPAGKKQMEIAAYLQGSNINVGEKMGDTN